MSTKSATPRKIRPPRPLVGPHAIPATNAPYELAYLKHPWRFVIGEWVHVLGFPDTKTFRIEAGFFRKGLPIYRLCSSGGEQLEVFQLHISSVPISTLRRRRP
jgi:hypothetical protein